jgi:hypothetical protein
VSFTAQPSEFSYSENEDLKFVSGEMQLIDELDVTCILVQAFS